MNRLVTLTLTVILVCLVVALSTDNLLAQQKQQLSFKTSAENTKYTQQHLIDVGDVSGHQVRVYELHRTFPNNAPVMNGVISAGLAILAVLVARLLWRLADPPPPPEPTVLGEWLDRAGRLAHYALYALLIAAPVAGIVLQFARGDALPLFGLSEIPSPWLADRAFARTVKEVHEVLANGLVILAGLHAAAALVHHWVFRDRTLVRMLPGSTR